MTEVSEGEKKITPEGRYKRVLERYHNMRSSLGDSPAMFRDPEGANERLHKLHLKLLEAGKTIEKNKNEVLADFLLLDKNLAEYGLPKIAVRDIPPRTLGHHIACDLVIDSGREIEEMPYLRIKFDDSSKPELSSSYGKEAPSIFQEWKDKDYVALIYYGYWGGMKWDPDITSAFTKKKVALQKVSKDFSLRVFRFGRVQMVPDMHMPIELFGLEVPSGRLEDIALKIRANREKYWITKEEEQNPYSKEVLRVEDERRLRQYFSYLEHNQLELKKDSTFGIPEGREKTVQGWYDLFNVVEVMGEKFGLGAEEVFRRSKESLRNYGSPYIPDEARKDIERLVLEGKKDEAEELRNRLENLLNER